MRRLKALLVLLPLFLLMLACSDDEATNPTPAHPLVGSWQLQLASENGTTMIPDEIKESPGIIEFYGDLRGKVHIYRYGTFEGTNEFTWRTIADKLFLTIASDPENDPASYVITDDLLRLEVVEGGDILIYVFKRA